MHKRNQPLLLEALRKPAILRHHQSTLPSIDKPTHSENDIDASQTVATIQGRQRVYCRLDGGLAICRRNLQLGLNP